MHRQIIALALVVVSVGTARADSDDLTVVGGMDFGFKKLHLDTGSGAGVFNPSFVTINPNLTLAYKSFYASLSYDKSISAEQETGATSGTATVTNYSRKDSTFTLGYRLNSSFNLFAGYTEGVNRFVATTAAVVLIVTDTTYTEKGPFAGASYTKAFGDKGNLGLSIAYGRLNGDLKIDVQPGSGSARFTGDTKGLSYGLSWSGPLTGSLSYRVALKETRYEMKDPITIKERYTSLFVGILNYF
jgi:hypothetical protein